MNNKFKRVLSSVLAFVMVFSSLVVMNVSSVSAALVATATPGTSAGVTAITADTDSYLYYYSMPSVSSAADTAITASDGTHTASVKLTSGTVSFEIGGTALAGQKASSKASNNVVKGVKAGETVVFDCYMNASSACTLSFKKGSKASASPDVSVDLGSAKAPFQVSIDVDEDTDLYFYNDQQLAIANIGVKSSSPAVGGNVSLSVTGGDNGTTNVTVAGAALANGESIDATAGDTVSISAVPNDGYKVKVTVDGDEVKLTDNAFSFTVNGDAAINIEYSESVEICDYNISNLGYESLANVTIDNITFGKNYTSVVAPFVTPVYLEDGTETPFKKAALPSGTGATITVAMNAGDTVGVYYTTSDSGFTTKDQAKSGYAQITGPDGTVVASDSNTANKTGNYAYYFEYTATETGTYTLSSSANRFVVFGLNYKEATIEPVTPKYTINGAEVTSGTVTINKKEYTIGESITLPTGSYDVIYTLDGTTYTGTLVVSEGETAPVVELTEVILPTLSDNAPSAGYYVGFAPKSGYNVYDTMTAALAVAPAGSTIYIAPGTYEEKIAVSNANITFMNAVLCDWWTDTATAGFTAKDYSNYGNSDTSDNAVVITHKYANAGDSYEFNAGTQASATVTVSSSATGFSAYGITFQNSYNLDNSSNTQVQAVALVTQATQVLLDNCRFIGKQDTLYLKTGSSYTSPVAKYVYVKDCYIEGSVDFVFGDATAYFDNCRLYMSGAGYYTAPNTFLSNIGYVFNGCTFDAASGVTANLGRSWQTIYSDSVATYNYTSSNTVLINSTINATVSDARWSTMGNTGYTEIGARTRFFEDSTTYNANSTFAYDQQLANASDYTAANVIGYDNGTWTTPSTPIAVTFTNTDATVGDTEMYALELQVDDTATLKAQTIPGSTTETITWTSSNESVATVEDGVVTAVAAGDCEIYATIASGAKATSYVTVKDAEALNIDIDFTSTGLYSTLSDSTSYTDGEYTDSSIGVTFYSTGCSYNSYGETYGIVPSTNVAIFSIEADSSADYVFTPTISSGNGSGTVTIYTDSALTNAVASGSVANGSVGTITYSKASADTETLYFVLTAASNAYISKVNITTKALTVAQEVTVKGTVTGLEADDTDAVITITDGTKTVTTTVADFANTGVVLTDGNTYTVTAVGKGVYNGSSFVAAATDSQSIELTRIKFEFPIDLATNFSDLSIFLGSISYTSNKYTDPYSGITLYQNGMIPYNAQYGAKTNSNDILEFTADKTGTYTVSFKATASNSDQVQLKVNGTLVEDTLTSVVVGSAVTMSVDANEGDIIGLYTPTRANLYYSYVDVEYTEPVETTPQFVFAGIYKSGTDIYVVGKIALSEDQLDTVDAVGFGISKTSIDDAKNNTVLKTTTVFKSITYSNNGATATISEDGYFFAGFKLTGVNADFYVAPFTTIGEETTYADGGSYTYE